MSIKFNGAAFRGSLLIAAMAIGAAHAQTTVNTNPAARQHVKIVNGSAVKFTSKLQRVIELNFTFGYDHTVSKGLIAQTLRRVAWAYGNGVDSAFKVKSFVGPGNGASQGLPTGENDFTLADLRSGQVIFANQISSMGSTTLGTSRRTAIQTAIETDGIGYFHLHGSGDHQGTSWPWYSSVLHPMDYKGHGDRTLGPVYKNPLEKEHIVTENVLVAGMTNMNVPTSRTGDCANPSNSACVEVTTDEPIRQIRNEWYRFNADIRTIPTLSPNLTVLSLYDPRNLGTALGQEYRRKGGNMYTYLYKVGNGMTHYLPAGHDNSEIKDAGGFDGGVGDWDRYFAQVLFFLAGYNQTPCDQSCNGLPVVDDSNHLTGQSYSTSLKGGYSLVLSELKLDAARPQFEFVRAANYNARLVDATGKVVMRSQGRASSFAFNTERLISGVYYMQVTVEGTGTRTQRYALTSGI